MVSANDKVIDTLNDLIEYCKDGQQGYRTAAADVENQELKDMFGQYAQQRANFAAELEQQVLNLGGNPTMGTGHESGALHRGWIDLRSAVSLGNEDVILKECERGENAALSAYDTALKKGLPTEVSDVINRQYTQIKDAMDRVHDMQKLRN